MSAQLLLYGYGSYGSSMNPSFSTTRLSLINRDMIWLQPILEEVWKEV